MLKILFPILIFSSVLSAHKLNIFTKNVNNDLYVSTYFANGKACFNCKIRIKSLNDELITEDITNNNGEWKTNININEFIISVDAGSGHVINKTIKKENSKNTIKNDLSFLEKENTQLKIKIQVLEKKLKDNELYKMMFALGIIFLIFVFLKRFKK